MKKITIIGDVHGKLERYKQIIDNCDFSICVGDFGFKNEWDEMYPVVFNKLPQQHKVNPGNHDYGPYLSKHLLSTGNFGWWPDYSIFTIRGADSIDKHLRLEGVDWFANEELNYQEQLEAYDWYCKVRPKIVISHDCPQTVMETLFGYPEKSQTRTMLQNMFDEHQPELWVFGHHHKSKDVNINGTRFVCLAELGTLEVGIHNTNIFFTNLSIKK